MRIAFYTLGCKVNLYESELLMDLFAEKGFDIVPHNCESDIYVINSCTVTAQSDNKTKKVLRRLRREHPGARICVCGCFPQAFPSEALPEADIVAGTSERRNLPGLISKNLLTGERIVAITPHKKNESFEEMSVSRFSGRTRAFVKIEDGCTRFCSYCIIPTARGPVRSKPLDKLKDELSALAQNGYKEIVLVGINLSCFGMDTGASLVDAVRIAQDIDGIERVRLGSLEPELLTPDIIDALSGFDKLCPQFHLSLQSGCDNTLRRMNRHYTTKEYLDIVNRFRTAFANASVTTDIMVGFPGESDGDFMASLDFAKLAGFAKMHVFPYSPRTGTKAAQMPDQVPAEVKQIRAKAMLAAADRLQQDFFETQVGTVQSVLFETSTGKGLTGYTENYTPVAANAPESLCGSIHNVRITGTKDEHCIGELV